MVNRLGSATAEGHRQHVGRVEMRAEVSDHGKAYQALGDQHVIER